MERTTGRIRTWVLLGASLTAATVGAPAIRAGDFVKGDLYLLTHAYPDLGRAIVRIDPVTGDKTVLLDDPDATNPHIMYDPFRDRLITKRSLSAEFVLVDAQGNDTTLPFAWHAEVVVWAAAGDGRIYMATSGAGYFGYLDADDQAHDLLDTDGVTPFSLAYGTTGREDLIYDVGTNSLFLVHFGAATMVRKIPLSSDGTQLAGPVETVSFDAFPSAADEPLGLSAGPAGTLFIKIDTNSSLDGLRMFTVDPATLQFEPFAHIGHPGVAANTTGTYNGVHAYGAALDTANDVIRTYVRSDKVQEGTILATGVSSGGSSGEIARLITIGDTINGFVAPSRFAISWFTVDGGGVMRSTGGDFELSGTAGQPDAGGRSGADFDLTGGFWFPLAAGDCDEDGLVGLLDTDAFTACMAGPAGAVKLACRCFDVNGNGSVDLADLAVIQSTFTFD